MHAETLPQFVRRVSIVSVLVIAFFVYPTLCQAILGVFSCYSIDTVDKTHFYSNTPLVSLLLYLLWLLCVTPDVSVVVQTSYDSSTSSEEL